MFQKNSILYCRKNPVGGIVLLYHVPAVEDAVFRKSASVVCSVVWVILLNCQHPQVVLHPHNNLYQFSKSQESEEET